MIKQITKKPQNITIDQINQIEELTTIFDNQIDMATKQYLKENISTITQLQLEVLY